MKALRQSQGVMVSLSNHVTLRRFLQAFFEHKH